MKSPLADTVRRYSVPENRKEEKPQGLVKKLRNKFWSCAYAPFPTARILPVSNCGQAAGAIAGRAGGARRAANGSAFGSSG